MKTLLPLLLLSSLSLAADSTMKVVALRCEQRVNPQGIDAPAPRLSWELASPERGQRQTAYRVLVATTLDKLDAGDLWDSGKVASDQSIHLAYAGKPLASNQACFWTVMVWDRDGNPSAWSEPARWSMGLLKREDWTGQWIGRSEEQAGQAFGKGGVSWIWFPEAKAGDPPTGIRYFRHTFHLPADRGLESITLLVASDNFGTVYIDGKEIGTARNFKAASRFDLGRLAAGPHLLAVAVDNVGEKPNPAGLLAQLSIKYADGGTQVSKTDDTWRCSDKKVEKWETPAFDDAAWAKAKLLGPAGMAPWGQVAGPEERKLAARYLRKEFELAKPVKRAMVHLSGQGVSELYLNGQKVGDHVLSPALSEYDKRVLYVTHDVTGMLKSGRNAAGAILGNGRYYAPRLSSPTLTRTYGYPRLLLELIIEHEDGSVTRLSSDESWKLTDQGPIRLNNEYDGEEYDARREMGGWAEAGFNDDAWRSVQIMKDPGGVRSAQMIEPIRVTGKLKPVKLSEPKPGVYIYDLGQNMVGWAKLSVSGPRGTTVTMRFAETLKPDGTLCLANIRDAKVTDRYTLRGEGVEAWEPRFVFHGFRFVEVTGFPGKPELSSIEGKVVNDDLETAGEFACSNDTINAFYRNITWGVRGNYRSIPTDCPQRDERQGWLGDRSAESRGEAFLFRNGLLYRKWLQDMADAQKESGSVPDVCPSYWPMYNDNVTWPASIVIIPQALIDQFGDDSFLPSHYPAMKKWIDHMKRYIKDDLMPRDTYGDWCVPPEDPKLIHSKDPARKTAGEILGTTYFYQCLRLMEGYAKRLGKEEDAKQYAALAERMKAAFNRKYFSVEKAQYDNGAQTTYVLPLAFGMVPEEHRARVFAGLVEKIEKQSKGHIGTGLVGGQWLMRTLTAGGRADIGYAFATHRDYPSWGYMLEKGATTVWELWNGDTADPAMNSGNHVMLVGDLVIWLNESVAGIKSAAPGFKHIEMKPVIPVGLGWVKASHRSPHGLVVSNWKIDGVTTTWEVSIPPNATATLHLPPGDVTEGGNGIKDVPGIKVVGTQVGGVAVEVGSGSYRFEVRRW